MLPRSKILKRIQDAKIELERLERVVDGEEAFSENHHAGWPGDSYIANEQVIAEFLEQFRASIGMVASDLDTLVSAMED